MWTENDLKSGVLFTLPAWRLAIRVRVAPQGDGAAVSRCSWVGGAPAWAWPRILSLGSLERPSVGWIPRRRAGEQGHSGWSGFSHGPDPAARSLALLSACPPAHFLATEGSGRVDREAVSMRVGRVVVIVLGLGGRSVGEGPVSPESWTGRAGGGAERVGVACSGGRGPVMAPPQGSRAVDTWLPGVRSSFLCC